MKAFYYEFFHIPKEGKIKEKVLMAHVTLTAVLIIVYLLAISGAAYAFHTSTVTVPDNIIMGAHFDTQIKIAGPDGELIEVEEQSDGAMLALLETPGEYEVKLEPGGTAETGFCIIQLDGEEYTSAQLGVSMEAPGEYREDLVFRVQVYEAAPMAFLSNWGTSSGYVQLCDDGSAPACYLLGGEIIEVGDYNKYMELLEQQAAEEAEEEELEEELAEEDETADEGTEEVGEEMTGEQSEDADLTASETEDLTADSTDQSEYTEYDDTEE